MLLNAMLVAGAAILPPPAGRVVRERRTIWGVHTKGGEPDNGSDYQVGYAAETRLCGGARAAPRSAGALRNPIRFSC